MANIRKMSLEAATEYANEMATKLGLPEQSFTSATEARLACIDLEKQMTSFNDTTNPIGVFAPFEADAPKTESQTEGVPSKYDTSDRRGPNLGTGAYARRRILEGADNKTILAEIREQYPEAKTSMASIAFYRNQVKKSKLTDPATLREQAARLRAEADDLDHQANLIEEAALAATKEAAEAEQKIAEAIAE